MVYTFFSVYYQSCNETQIVIYNVWDDFEEMRSENGVKAIELENVKYLIYNLENAEFEKDQNNLITT